MTRTTYSAESIAESGVLRDIRILIEGKTWHLWGRNGLDRETALADSVDDGTLPVLIGSGLGHTIKILTDRGIPVAVVDRETPLLELSDLNTRFPNPDNVLWVNSPDPQQALDELVAWQKKHHNKKLVPLVIPLYPRLNRDYYGALAETLKSSAQTDFWTRARYPKFRSTMPRILFFDSEYFLCNEIRSAMEQLGVEHRTIAIGGQETGSTEFIEAILQSTLDFQPDFVLTVNHFGLDRQGKLSELLDDLELPLASWFVDNPHLIVYDYAHPGTENTVVFTFDAGNLDEMRAKGFPHVHYLPLATDPHRFHLGQPKGQAAWASDVSFVGSSMATPVADSLAAAALPAEFAGRHAEIATAFGESGETSVSRFLEDHRPQWADVLKKLPTRENRLALESLLTWEATRQYRLGCVRATLEFSPLIVGDDGWDAMLGASKPWRRLDRIDYYADLPRFYPMSAVNLNCTSRQMIGAVNQRVFDVPACGGSVLTDHRDQMEDLFDIGKEVVTYRNPEEIPTLIERALADPTERAAVSKRARKRIMAHHTYEIRLRSLMETMRSTFS